MVGDGLRRADPDQSRRVIAYDRIIESALALPGALDAPGGGRPEWQVIVEDVGTAPPFAAGCVWHDGQLVWSINPAEQHVVCDRQLLVRHSSTADPRSVSENAIANGLAALAWIAGDVVLHAAAVVMPGADSAIAIMAPSGGGKSTLLNELMNAGACLLADDTLVLRREGSQWIGSGLAGGWFMRMANGRDRTFIAAPADRSRRCAAIGALFCLSLEPEAPVAAMQRCDSIAAVSSLLHHRHRAMVARAIGTEAANLAIFASIAAAVPVVTWARQLGCLRLTNEELAAIARAPDSGW